MKVDTLESYCLLLQQEKAAVFCNYVFTAVAMQDFNVEKLSLKVRMHN